MEDDEIIRIEDTTPSKQERAQEAFEWVEASARNGTCSNYSRTFEGRETVMANCMVIFETSDPSALRPFRETVVFFEDNKPNSVLISDGVVAARPSSRSKEIPAIEELTPITPALERVRISPVIIFNGEQPVPYSNIPNKPSNATGLKITIPLGK